MSEQGNEQAYYALNRRVYAWFARWYDPLVRALRPLRRDVVDLAGVGSDANVLDVATGTGEQARAFAARGCAVVGIDISDAMLRVAQQKAMPGVAFQRADATQLPFRDQSFAVVCVSFALHEMPGTVRLKVLRELRRVTKEGGVVVVVDYGLPRHPVARAVVFHLVKLYERDEYARFIATDLEADLRDAGIQLMVDQSTFLGAVRIGVGSRDVDAFLRTPENQKPRPRSANENVP